MPKVQPQEQLPGEEPKTFADYMLQEVLEGDDVLASFKFTRFNNYKRNTYDTLRQYEQPAALQQRHSLNRVVQSLFSI